MGGGLITCFGLAAKERHMGGCSGHLLWLGCAERTSCRYMWVLGQALWAWSLKTLKTFILLNNLKTVPQSLSVLTFISSAHLSSSEPLQTLAMHRTLAPRLYRCLPQDFR